MSYLQRILQPGETLRHVGRLHWVVYCPGFVLFLLAATIYVATFAFIHSGDAMTATLGAVAVSLAASAVTLFIAAVRRWTTEIAVTDRRVIFKGGVIRRHTIEMNMDKVESVDVDQSLAGRVFGYGDITVHGTGSSIEPFRRIGRPLAFRNHVTAR